MATTRPYRIHFNGEVRMVEATHRSAAIAHLASELVADCRPAKASEVAAHCRNGGTVEVANAQAEAESKARRDAPIIVADEIDAHGDEPIRPIGLSEGQPE